MGLEIRPLTKHIGAQILGIDLRQPLDEATRAAIYKAWLDHLVIVFPDQKLEQEDLLRVSSYFGEIGALRRPPKFFPPGFNRLLPNIMLISNIRENGEPIGALPDGEMMFHHDMIHAPIPHNGFRTHEETKRKAIYVNRLMTVGIEGMDEAQSQPLLEAVFDHAERDEFVYEHVWSVGDLLLWDNRCSSHARTDFPADQRRLMLRTTIEGTVKPY